MYPAIYYPHLYYPESYYPDTVVNPGCVTVKDITPTITVINLTEQCETA